MDLIQNIRRLKQIKKQTFTSNNLPVKNNIRQIQGMNNQQNQSLNKNKQKQKMSKVENMESSIKKQLSVLEQKSKEKQQNTEQKLKIEILKKEKIILKQTQQISKNELHGEKIKQNKLHEGGLFRGLVFCFPMYNVELTKTRGKAIKITIQRLQDLQQFIDFQSEQNTQQPIFSLDFMLVDSKIPRQTIEAAIPPQIKYRGIVDFNFVFQCINQNKILNYSFFLVPQRSKQLQNYIKAKQAQKMEEMQNSSREKVLYKFAAGIEPLDNSNNQKSIIKPPAAFTKNNQNTVQSTQTKNQNIKSEVSKPPPPKRSFNKYVYQSFEKLSQLFQKSDRGRSFAYSRIATVLKSVKFQITCEQDADKLKGMRFIGPKTIQKIKQFIQNGSIEKLTVMQGKQQNLVCQKLEKVWGIGKIKAQQLYIKGIKTVQQLRQYAQSDPTALTKNQKIGLKYYQDLNERIPRDKVTRMFQYIKSVLFRIVGSENDYKIQVCGSYRRGKQTCGDIDVIITRKDGAFQNRLINSLVEQLTKQGFLTDHLAMPRHENPKSCISYMGICKYQDQTHHRVDFKYYPVDQYAYAILYFTGSDMFNRNMRLYAMKNGYCLSDHGMWKAEKIGANIVTHEPGIPCYTQQEIFQKLGIKYKAPAQRSL